MYRSLPQKKVDSNKNKLHDHEVPKFFYLSAIKQKHSIDTHIVGVLGLKRRKKEKNVFSKKPDFRKNRISRIRIRIRWFRSIRGVTLRSQEVRRSEKSEKKFPEKIRISRIRIRISGSTSMPLRSEPKGLPVAKISRL